MSATEPLPSRFVPCTCPEYGPGPGLELTEAEAEELDDLIDWYAYRRPT